jgi:hypothetical protein
MNTETLEYALTALIKTLHRKGIIDIDDVVHEVAAASVSLGLRNKEEQALLLAKYISAVKQLCEK